MQNEDCRMQITGEQNFNLIHYAEYKTMYVQKQGKELIILSVVIMIMMFNYFFAFEPI